MTDDKTVQYMLRDVIFEVREWIAEAERKIDGLTSPEHAEQKTFDEGRLLGLREVLDILYQEAEFFEIPLRDLALDDYKPM